MTHDPNPLGRPTRDEHSLVNPAKKILVVDDDDDTRELLRLFFQRFSFEVNEAANNDEALEKIQSWEPDLVTSDQGRPNGSGLELLRSMKERGISLPVVFITAQPCREACMAEGAADFIEKPFDPKQLLEVVRKVLSETKAREQAVRDKRAS